MTTAFDFGGLSDVFFSGAATGEAKDDAFEAFSVASPEQVIPASPAASLSTPLHTPTHSTPAHHGLGELDDLLGGENEHGNQLDAATIHDLMSDAAPWGLSGQPNSFDSVAAFPSVGNVFAGLNMDGSMDPVDLRSGGGGGFDGFAEPAPVSCLITSSSSSNASSDAGSSGGDEAEEEETASKRPFSPPQTRAAAKAKAAAVAAASTNTDSDPAPMTKQKKKGKRGRKPKSQSAAATEQTSGGYSTKNGGKKGTKKRASGRRPGRPSRYTEVDVEVNIPDEPVAEGAYDGMSEGQIAEEERKRKNRLAAKASRLKRKIFLENLETNYETLSTEHEAALDTIDALEAERNTLAREVAYLRGIIDNSETLAGIFGDVAPRLRALRDRNAGRKRSASAAYDDDDDEDDAENDFGATGLCVCLRANGEVSVEMCSSCADPRPPSKRTKVEA